MISQHEWMHGIDFTRNQKAKRFQSKYLQLLTFPVYFIQRKGLVHHWMRSVYIYSFVCVMTASISFFIWIGRIACFPTPNTSEEHGGFNAEPIYFEGEDVLFLKLLCRLHWFKVL